MQYAWDATSLELAQTCARKYYYSMQGYRPKQISVHLLFGKLYADALEQFYKLRAEGKTLDDALAIAIKTAMINSYWEYENGEAKAIIWPIHSAKTRANLMRTVVWYVDTFGEETEHGIKTHVLKNGRAAVEVSFTLEISDDIIACGHLDKIVDYGGDQYILDNKTTGATPGDYYFEQFTPNNQVSMYTWAGGTLLRSPIKGMMIDAAQIAVGFSRFERRFITRSEAAIEEWFDNTLQTISQFRSYAALNMWPMNLSACGNYGGCPFRPVCSASPTLRENVLRGGYTKTPSWDPLDRR